MTGKELRDKLISLDEKKLEMPVFIYIHGSIYPIHNLDNEIKDRIDIMAEDPAG